MRWRPQVPADWTPEQALRTVEFLDDILAAIWAHHEDAICFAIEHREHSEEPVQQTLPIQPDPDIPF